MGAEAARSKRTLTAEQWNRIRDLLANAIQLPANERPVYLNSVCQNDAALRGELESLLAAHDIADDGRFEWPVIPTNLGENLDSGAQQIPDLAGKRVGAYHLEVEIGHGGMGKVYRARRADDRFSKQVAIKFLDRSAVSERSLQLFRQEREILANLEHPNIARLLDAGESEDAVPYFVMEYVDGESLDSYCDAHRLTIEERLSLFEKVCSAVHYAHQNLVIHRDIKPDNILVTQSGEPKLLDFGVAKVIDANANTRTMTGWRVLTPAYASPEQLLGKPLNVATDVYSLGLVLYELLTGRYAYDERQSALELQHAILAEDPQHPSTAVLGATAENGGKSAGEISAARQLTSEKLYKKLHGDLGNIVLKAIRKDPTERYASVERLAEDIERHLHGLPVQARQGTFTYTLRKFVLRNKIAVLAASFAFLFAILGVVLLLREAHIARLQQARAERRFNDVRKLANSLLFEIHDSISKTAGTTAARKLILERSQEYLDSLSGDVKSDPSLLGELAAAYTRLGSVTGNGRDANLGDSGHALKDYRRAAELREMVVALSPMRIDPKLELAQSDLDVALALTSTGGDREEEDVLAKVMTILDSIFAANSNNTRVLSELAQTYELRGFLVLKQGRPEESIANHEKSLTFYQRASTSDPKNPLYQSKIAFAHKHIGAVLYEANRQFGQALEHYRTAQVIEEGLLKADPSDQTKQFGITFTYSDAANILSLLGKTDEAMAYYNKSFQIRSALVAADPENKRARYGLASNHQEIAELLGEQKHFAEALKHQLKAFDIRKSLLEADQGKIGNQRAYLHSEAGVAKAYAQLAFAPRTGRQQQLSYCKEAAAWFDKARPELQKHKDELTPLNFKFYVPEVQQAANRCNAVLAR